MADAHNPEIRSTICTNISSCRARYAQKWSIFRHPCWVFSRTAARRGYARCTTDFRMRKFRIQLSRVCRQNIHIIVEPATAAKQVGVLSAFSTTFRSAAFSGSDFSEHYSPMQYATAEQTTEVDSSSRCGVVYICVSAMRFRHIDVQDYILLLCWTHAFGIVPTVELLIYGMSDLIFSICSCSRSTRKVNSYN